MEITGEIAAKILETVDAGLCSGIGNPIPGQMCVEAAVCYGMGLPHSDEPSCVAPKLRTLKIALNDKNWSSKATRANGLRRLALVQLGSAGTLDESEFVRRLAILARTSCVVKALRSAASIHPVPFHKETLLAAALKCEDPADAAANAYAAANAANAANAAYAADAADAADAAYAAYAAAAANAANAAAYPAYAYAAADAAYAAAAAAAAAAYAYAANAYAADAERDRVLAEFAEDVVQILIDMKVPGVIWLPLTEI